jgi:DNA-binding transcriptional regulator GbsR (MarR family)
MNKEKKQLYNGWLATSNYVFNKSVSAIKQGHSVNFQDLRNKFVTANTKKNDPRYQEIDETLKNLRNNSRKASNDEKEKIQKQIEEQKVKLSEIKKEIKSVKNEGVFEFSLNFIFQILAKALKLFEA